MKTYTYQGPANSSVTLRVGGSELDVMLFRGKTVELPEDHDYVQTLIGLEHLVPVDIKVTAVVNKAEPAKKGIE